MIAAAIVAKLLITSQYPMIRINNRYRVGGTGSAGSTRRVWVASAVGKCRIVDGCVWDGHYVFGLANVDGPPHETLYGDFVARLSILVRVGRHEDLHARHVSLPLERLYQAFVPSLVHLVLDLTLLSTTAPPKRLTAEHERDMRRARSAGHAAQVRAIV